MPDDFCRQRYPDKVKAQHGVRHPDGQMLQYHQPGNHPATQHQQGQPKPQGDLLTAACP